MIKDKVATSSEYFITKNLKINSILTPIEITNSNNESKSSILDCLIFHESPRDFPEVSIEIDWDCIDSGGGGDSSDNTSSEGGSSTPSGSTGTSGSSNAPGGGGNVLVYPNGGSTNTPALPNPCETLNEAIQDSKVNQAIQVLKTKTTTDKETAFVITRKYNSANESYTYNTELKDGDGRNTTVPVGGYIKGNAHNHPKNGQSIPSIGDVFWLMQCQTNIFPASSNGYNIVVVPNPASPNDTSTAIIYAISVSDLATLTSQINAVFGANFDSLTIEEKKDLYDEINDKYAEKFANVQNSSAGMEQKFLALYANFGISLHKYDTATSNWNKLNLTNNTVTPQPFE